MREALRSLESDARNGILQILERDAIKQTGAFADAWFLVVMKPAITHAATRRRQCRARCGDPQAATDSRRNFPEMRASFLVTGPGIARCRDLGVIDMRRIAPTVAQLLKVRLGRDNCAAAGPPMTATGDFGYHSLILRGSSS